MAAPDVSVVTTVYNGAAHLEACVRSVREQEGVSFEHVVVDDGSTDATPELLDGLAHSRLITVRGPRVGRARALNEALSRCRGRYVAVLDADDVALPGRLSRPVAFLDADPEVDLVGSNHWVLIDGSGAELGRRVGPVSGDETIRRLLRRHRAPFAHSSVTAKRSTLERVGGYDEELLVDLDLGLYVRVAADGRLAVLDHPLVELRRHDGQYFFGRDGDTRSLRARIESRRQLDRRADAAFGGSTSAVAASGRELGSWLYWRTRRLVGPGPVLPTWARRQLDRFWIGGRR